MSRRLPPLNALRTFEVAARHLSFTDAAGELFVTQAAVSHQIKALEQFLGIRLFRRAHRRLLLTEAGQQYFRDLRPLFAQLHDITEKLLTKRASGTLTVSLTPSFAISWLVPRLSEFAARHPEIDVRIKAVDREEGHLDQEVDVAFFYGRGRWPGLIGQQLHAEYRIPVCAPQIAAQLQEPDDLRQVTLLHDGSRQDWKRWLRQAGARGVNAEAGPLFSHSTLAQQAAMLGQGVALGHSTLAKPDLEAGRLVCPFKQALLSRNAYYLVYSEDDRENGKILAFRDWVVEKVSADERAPYPIEEEL